MKNTEAIHPGGNRGFRSRLAGTLALFAALTAGGAGAAPTPPTGPQDFAWGREITAPGGAAFYRLTLPDDIYQQAAWPDLRDLRVFDQAGHPVPFAIRDITAPPATPQRVALSVFPLRIGKQSQRENGDKLLSLRRPDGTELVVTAPVNDTSVRSTYLLAAGEADAETLLGYITLGWPAGHTGQAWGTLLGSDNMKDWDVKADAVPLFDLSADKDRLMLNRLELGEYGANARYWLLLMYADDAQALPVITSAEGAEATGEPAVEQVILPLKGSSDKEHQQGVYQLVRPQYLSTLTIEPTEINTVLPLAIETRPGADAPWVPLVKQVFYNLEQHAAPRPVGLSPARLIQAVRVTAIDTQWGDFPPRISGERPRVGLVFNAGGKGPWLLAFGSRAAQATALPPDRLLPGNERDLSIAEATLDKRISLGGEKRLNELAPAERRASWMRFLLWGLLVAGAAGLMYMAFRLWRDIGRGGSPG